MPDIGWTELLLIACIAIIVVGPKDLPRLLRTVGNWMGQARRMADEFRRGLDDIAREAELEELRGDIETMRSARTIDGLNDTIDPTTGKDVSGLDKGGAEEPDEEGAVPRPRIIEGRPKERPGAERIEGDGEHVAQAGTTTRK